MDEQYRHLTAEERAVVIIEHRKRVSLRAIARELGRNVSTISREVRRKAFGRLGCGGGEGERDCAIAALSQGDAALQVLNWALRQPSGPPAPCAGRAVARPSGARR